MTPRHGFAAAVAVLFLSAPALGALPEAPAACPFMFVPEDEKADWIVPSKPECDFLMSLDDDFVRLTDAASFARGKVSLSRMIFIEPDFNAHTDRKLSAVFINDKFVKKLMSDRPAAVWVLAHEVGHFVQYRDGEGVKRDAVLESAGEEGQAWKDFKRVFESQADRIGDELMARARFPIRSAAAVDAALVGRVMHLSSEHTHPANGIRWLEALKHQRELEYARDRAARRAINRRARALMARPAFDRDPDTRADNDNSTPMQWAATEKAAPYADKGKYAAGHKLEDFNRQGRLTPKFPVFAIEVPPLSAAPGGARAQPGVEELSLSDRLALRARTLGTPTSYAGAVWSGAYDWFLDGGWWRKSENPAPTKPVAAKPKP